MTNCNQNNTNYNNSQLLNTDQTAEYLGVGKFTLSVRRSTKRYNIHYVKVGRLIKYRKSGVDKWLDERICGNSESN